MDHPGITSRLSTIIVLLSGGLIVMATAIIVVEIVVRRLFSLSLGGADELAGYCFAISCVLAWIYCVIERSNISIDALHARLPLKLRVILDVFGLALMLLVASVLIRTAFSVVSDTARTSARSLTPLATPLIVPQSIWFASLALLLVTLSIVLLRALFALIRGDWQRVIEIAGAPSTEDLITEEIERAQARGAAERRGD